MKMVIEENAQSIHRPRAKSQDQDRKRAEPDDAAEENGQCVVADAHFGNRGTDREDFEGRGRRQHRGKHETPEGMFFKGRMQLVKPFRGDPLAQQLFSSLVADRVHDQAAERGTGRREQHVQGPPFPIGRDVSADHHIHGQADGAAVQGGGGENTPNAQRLEDRPEKQSVAGEDMLDGIQRCGLMF